MDDATYEMLMDIYRIVGFILVPFYFVSVLLVIALAWKSYRRLTDIENHLRILVFHKPPKKENCKGN